MSDDTKYLSDHLQALLRVLETLFGHEVTGMLPGDLAQKAECAASQVTRLVANLRHRGWVETVPDTGRIRLGPMPVQAALRHLADIERAERRLAELKNRYSRNVERDDAPQPSTDH